MRRGASLALGVAALGLAAQLLAAAPPAPLADRFAQAGEPALTRVGSVHDAAFTWDGLQFYFVSGQMALGGAGGRTTTAVFEGEGALKVEPPAGPAWRQTIEQGQMERFLGRDLIEAGFTQAVFRFAEPALWLRALGAKAEFRDEQAPGNLRGLLHERAQEEERSGNDGLARLQAALGQANPGAFLVAEVKARDGRWIELDFDPGAAEPLRVAGEGSRDEPPEIWTNYAPAGWPAPPRWQASDYSLQATATRGTELSVRASFRLQGDAALGRGAILRLDPRLRVTGANLPWYQPAAPGNWIYLELPEAGAATPVTLEYAGAALEADPSARDWATAPGWYPAPDGAEFGGPEHFQLAVQAGERAALESAAEGRSAGFTVGEDAVETRTLKLADGQPLQVTVAAPKRDDPEALTALAGTKLVDVANFLAGLTGSRPYAQEKLAVTSAPAVALPGLVSFDPRSFLGLDAAATQFAPALTVATQWWETAATPATVHEEWLAAGLSEVSALLYQESRYGVMASRGTVEAWRHYLQTPGEGSHRPPLASGPLWLGAERLTAPHEDGEALLESKAGAELYMLRQMLWQPQSPAPDAGFTALLHDLMRRYAGRAITNAEFQALAEAHMTPAMDLDRNHKLDWFFQPLLYGTGVQILQFHAAMGTDAKGGAQVTLTVDNPGHWRGLLPVYIFRDRASWIRGLMPVTHDHETLVVPVGFMPQYVEANYLEDMLVGVRQ